MPKIDGHVHSPFCPHGSRDSFELYVERAMALGYSAITFTEHAPLPEGFVDTTPDRDSGMDAALLSDYFRTIDILKEKYEEKITIRSGLEVDYIEGFEKETKKFLTTYGPRMDDSILSVHFLKYGDQWDCLDFSPDTFRSMIGYYGSVDEIYKRYYETVLKSIQADLGPYKPKRIGHMTLVKKFQQLYPASHAFSEDISSILQEVASRDLELDYNGAGFVKPHCGESYPPLDIVKEARALGIKTVYGSDAHTAKGLDQGRTLMDI
ncbi:histidinol phosphatase [Bacillus sp. AFS015802]|uniref:histidinol-phosphatase HisJ n=1 Tax=Bacillus sp. AFS015802 TaxID=2033486 RepID=UPI000BF76063|nr:histidinol-phosphatase HisJ [Bacillus sp. AFS015802]PFA69696.1 histidinol phosphatase [Bacillus sp. AFS015802]